MTARAISAPGPAELDAARLLLARMGISPADLQQAAPTRPAAPTFAEYIPVVSAAVELVLTEVSEDPVIDVTVPAADRLAVARRVVERLTLETPAFRAPAPEGDSVDEDNRVAGGAAPRPR